MKTLVSGIKPTGNLTLGNYLGAIKRFTNLKDSYSSYIFIADLHALTLPSDPAELSKNILSLAKVYIACGLADKVKLYRQSKIAANTELGWIILCNTNLSDLTKMPQYKNYFEKINNKAIPSGMLAYPALMAADILILNADIVPVGSDQMSHIFLTQEIARNMNKKYPNIFPVIPGPLVQVNSDKIMSLSDPTKKMSKSESDKGTIYILEDFKNISEKIRKATTDAEQIVKFDPENKPGVSNLISIYSALTGKTFLDIENEFKGTTYKAFKDAILIALETELMPLQYRVNHISDEEVYRLLEKNEQIVEIQSRLNLDRILEVIGLHGNI